jgi:hypothetical protein
MFIGEVVVKSEVFSRLFARENFGNLQKSVTMAALAIEN